MSVGKVKACRRGCIDKRTKGAIDGSKRDEGGSQEIIEINESINMMKYNCLQLRMVASYSYQKIITDNQDNGISIMLLL